MEIRNDLNLMPTTFDAKPANIPQLLNDLASVKTDLEQMAEEKIDDFPRLAWESVKAGLAQEAKINAQLDRHIEEAQKLQKDIDLLLDFSAELTAHKEGQKELSDKAKSLLAQLKERDIDLWKGEGTPSKEKISELKSLSSAQVDKIKSNLQIIFTTKIQVLITSIGMIMDTLKDIIRQNSKLINAALQAGIR